MPPESRELAVLRRRAEFLAVAAGGKKWITTAFILQWAPSSALDSLHLVRFGLTASGKVGNAVVRNRARRRLRALAREVLPAQALAGHDYVLIARVAACTRDYQDMKKDLLWALRKLGASREERAKKEFQI